MNIWNASPQLVQDIGWTLIHSIWQGLVLLLALRVVTRAIPAGRSDLRYWAGVSTMVMMLLASVVTFCLLHGSPSTGATVYDSIAIKLTPTSEGAGVATWWSLVVGWIDSHIIWLLRFWILGFTIGLCRIGVGLWYIDHLRRNSKAVDETWMSMVSRLSQRLRIDQAITMAEASISAPLVVGFFKPMVLFPVGLLAGLTVEQVETILVHELAHVRRQDYLINLFQSIIETIFFFNPFVLLISSVIREERENCCDDLVLAYGVSPISYARTLAQLETSRTTTPLALGFAGNKNQLLNRIKRIMENSAKNDWGKGRLVPIALLFLGFVCASWLTIGDESQLRADKPVDAIVTSPDTTGNPRKSPDVSRQSGSSRSEAARQVIIVPGFPGETFVYDGKTGDKRDFRIEMPGIDLSTFDRFVVDSMPPIAFHSFNDEEWIRMENEFRKKFESQFKDFYKKNQKEFDKMMEELRKEQAQSNAALSFGQMDQLRQLSEMQANQMRFLDEDMQALRQLSEEDRAEMEKAMSSAQEMAYGFDIEDMEDAEDLLDQERFKLDELHDIQMHEMDKLQQEQFDLMNKQLGLQYNQLIEMAAESDAYTSELHDQLVKDGYIKKGQGLGELNIRDDGKTMSINGMEIKEKDLPKYRKIHEKYFQERFERQSYGRPE